MKESFAYIIVVTEPAEVESAVVLSRSIQNTETIYPVVIVDAAQGTTDKFGELFNALRIKIVKLPSIENPNNLVDLTADRSYSKINVFALEEYSKIIMIDPGMLVIKNIDEVFGWPHMSAVNCGGMLPECQDWTNLNANLLVIQPDINVFDELKRYSNFFRTRYGFQGLMQLYFNSWQQIPSLHLPHTYNVYASQYNRYNELFHYCIGPSLNPSSNPIKVLNYRNMKTGKLDGMSRDESSISVDLLNLWSEYTSSVLDTIKLT
ncbi:MAG TPA: hypothetical protein VGD40_02745 [Chryseosolibacter sp.]